MSLSAKNVSNDAPTARIGLFSAFTLVAMLVIIASSSFAYFYWQSRTPWPHFPSDAIVSQSPSDAEIASQEAAAASPAPEVVVSADRDYAYRIGDIVPVTIFLKEKKGTEIDMHSMAVQGDFEVVGDPNVFVRRTADGGRLIRLKVKLQSFSPTLKLGFNANLSYRLKSSNVDVTVSLPAFEAYTSETWDGRDIIQEGQLAFDPGYEPFATGALLFGGLFGTIFYFGLMRRYGREKAMAFEFKTLPNRFLLARRDFNAIWALIESGDRSADRYAEISALVRRLYRVETKTTLEASYYLLYSYNGPIQVTDILRACDRVIYRAEVLSESDHQNIKAVFDYLVPTYDANVLAELPPTKVVQASVEATLK